MTELYGPWHVGGSWGSGRDEAERRRYTQQRSDADHRTNWQVQQQEGTGSRAALGWGFEDSNLQCPVHGLPSVGDGRMMGFPPFSATGIGRRAWNGVKPQTPSVPMMGMIGMTDLSPHKDSVQYTLDEGVRRTR